MHDGGTHTIRDPQREKRKVMKGHQVNPSHDGHAGFIKLGIAQSLEQRDARALTDFAEAMTRGIRNAKDRETTVIDDDEEGTYVHSGSVNAGCNQGRHRATVIANAGADFARSLGATVKVRYAHLYSGIVPKYGKNKGEADHRGPCGCHHNVYQCQLLKRMGSQALSAYAAADEEANTEAEAIFATPEAPQGQVAR